MQDLARRAVNTDHVVVQGSELWCKACGQRQPLQLPINLKNFLHFCKTWVQAHEQCALIDQDKTLRELRQVANDLLDQNKRLVAAIDSLPETLSYEWAQHRYRLRKVAGLEASP